MLHASNIATQVQYSAAYHNYQVILWVTLREMIEILQVSFAHLELENIGPIFPICHFVYWLLATLLEEDNNNNKRWRWKSQQE